MFSFVPDFHSMSRLVSALDTTQAAKLTLPGLPRLHPDSGGAGNVTTTSSDPVHFITASG